MLSIKSEESSRLGYTYTSTMLTNILGLFLFWAIFVSYSYPQIVLYLFESFQTTLNPCILYFQNSRVESHCNEVITIWSNQIYSSLVWSNQIYSSLVGHQRCDMAVGHLLCQPLVAIRCI